MGAKKINNNWGNLAEDFPTEHYSVSHSDEEVFYEFEDIQFESRGKVYSFDFSFTEHYIEGVQDLEIQAARVWCEVSEDWLEPDCTDYELKVMAYAAAYDLKA